MVSSMASALVPVVKASTEAVNHPTHYNQGKIEVIDFIEDQQLGFCVGNAVKYLCRYQYKGTPIQDLKKAIWYINYRIAQLEEAHGSPKEGRD